VWLKVYTQPRIRRFNLKALESCAPVGRVKEFVATQANKSTSRPVSVAFSLGSGRRVFSQAATDVFQQPRQADQYCMQIRNW